MKIKKKGMIASSLALLMLALPSLAVLVPATFAEESARNIQSLQVRTEPFWDVVWYKFETPLITLIFPAGGKKPMFLWWYTNDNRTIYVMKFKGVIEYLTFDLPYYDRRYNADNLTIQQWIRERCIEPKLGGFGSQERERLRNRLMEGLIWWLMGLHAPFLPFSACTWELTGPELVSKDDVSYWSFNFTLKNVPMPRFEFAEGNIAIRCRFYATNATETLDSEHSYTVAAGQLKFDFVVSGWEWNVDKIENFVEWLETNHPNLDITIPPHKTGLALWINMASIKLEYLNAAKNEVQNQYQETVETCSQMQATIINDEYYPVNEDKTQNEYEKQVRVTSRFRNCTRIRYANVEGNVSGFLEFVPWARLLDENGTTVNVTASYIAAGGHLRLFICYPYFGNYTLEHDPTVGLDLAPQLPTLAGPVMLWVLVGATIVIAVAVAAAKLRKPVVNIVSV